jgi:pseudouridine-5'-phosphate glycosidase
VREAGALPAFVALLEGRVVVGAGEEELVRLADPGVRAAKAGVRDLAALLLAGRDAGTTVSATVAVAAMVGIRVFATGGIGGVHRAAPEDGALRDRSSDLVELARRPVCTVAAGPKVILDVAATAEELESLGVPVVGWRTAELPAFYVARSGVKLEHRVDDAAAVAALLRLHWRGLGRTEGVLLCVAPPEPLPAEVVEGVLAEALAEARARRLAGKLLTPFLLQALDRGTGGAARGANVALLEANARVAGQVAAALVD